MTRVGYCFLLVVLMLSCQDRHGDTGSMEGAEATAGDSVVPFNGTWVIESYIDTLLRTRSAARSQGSEYFVCFPRSLSDTAYTFVYHEGGGQFRLAKHGGSYFLMGFGQPSDPKEVTMLDGGRKLRIGSDTFVKKTDNIGIPEQVLFKGSYQLGAGTIVFSEDGTVTGLDNIRYYSIQNDYIGPGYGAVDIIFLGTIKDPQEMYCFEFSGDTLVIYDVMCVEQDANGTCLDLEKGALKYKLTAIGKGNP